MTRNISTSGVFVESDLPVSVGEQIRLLISDDKVAKILRVSAVVVHVLAGVGFGAKFVIHGGDRARDSVDTFVRRLCKN
jgi:hypothetical protein